jgi:hypothetical protein
MIANMFLTYADITAADGPVATIATWRLYTDSSATGTFAGACPVKYKDAFNPIKDVCPTGYPELANSPSNGNIAGPNCLIIPSWKTVS